MNHDHDFDLDDLDALGLTRFDLSEKKTGPVWRNQSAWRRNTRRSGVEVVSAKA